METEIPTRGARALDALAESTHRQGKESAVEGVFPFEEYGWLYPHHVDKINSETWDRLRMILIGSPKVSRYEKEPTLEDRHQPTRHLDMRVSVLESRVSQLNVVEQFSLPFDEETLEEREVTDVILHLSLRSHLVRGALVEQKIFGQMEQV
ncbi:uncharacterized protein A4U43_C10F14160 [Asparagus officinalis]|uniref:Uncharacterized protein n=1 Tax=Asparagus officinalis TaxID=4686 RepID=A0A5P1E605_ASPOF|nr:uncharacterized protein A4U43_C10F14160 [Asparagus officinalis]